MVAQTALRGCNPPRAQLEPPTARPGAARPPTQTRQRRGPPLRRNASQRAQRLIPHESAHNRGSDLAEELRDAEDLLTNPQNGSSAAAAISSNGRTRHSSNGAEPPLNGAGPSLNGAAVIESPGVELRAISGNGAPSNGAAGPSAPFSDVVSSNGAISGSTGNGATPRSNGATPRIIPAGTKKVNYTTNGVGPAAATAEPVLTADEVEGYVDACDVGQLEACAAQRITDSQDGAEGPSSPAAAAAPAPDSVRGTPYSSPSGRWSNFKSYSTFQRTWQIWSFAFAFAVRYFALRLRFTYGRAGMTPAAVVARRSKLAAWLREGLVKLGPTFIKIGQQFSTRVDVLSKEFVSELEKLQDNVPAFESAQAVAIVERNLGGPIGAHFESFDMTPIAAASLGQVHLAKLRGETVVVKVQRPGLKALFDIDLKNIRVLAQWLQRLDPQSDGAARDWVAIYDECSRILYQEIDYRLEGQSADRFRKNFAGKEWIKVPKIDWEHTTSEVLTMEYCPGIKINRAQQLDAAGIDRKRLAKLSVESYLEQLLTYGFFHADPHPGNIAVDAVGGGRLIYYDFGMMGTIPSDVRSGLLELFYAVYEKNPDRCIDALVTMGVLIPGNDMTAVRRTAAFFLTNFEERLIDQRAQAEADPEYDATFKGPRSKEEKKEKRKAILAAIGEDLLVASADKPFRFPATFTFVVRSFTVLDGIGKSLNPRFDISEIAAPYARGLLLEARPQFAQLFKEFRKRAGKQNRAVRNLFTGPNMIEDVATTVASLRTGDLKLRVRALEAERALDRVQAQQKAVTTAIVASTLVNVGTVLSVSAMRLAANFAFAGATFFGLSTLLSLLKIKRQQQKEAMITGAA